jgi:hypothetical protein
MMIDRCGYLVDQTLGCFWSSLHRPGCKDFFEFYEHQYVGANPPHHTIVHLKRFATTLAGRVQYRNIKRMVFEELVSRHHEKVKNLQHAACSFYIYIYDDDQLYMNIALFLQVRMIATKLQSNNIDVGLVSHTHDLYV